MPYATGETPKVGDRVENEAGQIGTVTGLEFDRDGESYSFIVRIPATRGRS